MKCDNWIDPQKVSKRGKLLKSAFLGTFEALPNVIKGHCPTAEKCGGDIVATIDLHDEPYYGGTSATLDITYKCSRCNEFLFGRVLSSEPDELSVILTAYVAKLKQRPTRNPST